MELFDFSQYMSGWTDWAILFFCAVLIGMSKTGIQGIGTVVAPILALVFGGKPSTGLLLPMLCMADLIAVVYYRRNAEWKYIVKLLPTAILGFFVAIGVDKFVPQSQFKLLIAFCIFAGLVVMFWTERKGKDSLITSSKWFSPTFGLFGGFTTMIGNAAGPIMGVYLLSMRLPKYAFVGTSAWFFLIVNYLKLPLQIFVWDNITVSSFMLNLVTLPFIIIGAVIGIFLVKYLAETRYRLLIIWLTILSTLMLIF